jgi:hypothetical protein
MAQNFYAMKQRLLALLGLALAVITILAGLSYFLIQQLQRQDANDPQIQIAEDAAAAFNAGQPVPSMDQAGSQIDIEKSLSTFIIIYDATGTAVFSTGLIHNTVPTPPASVFSWVKAHGEDQLTWQPATSVRIAAVLTPYNSTGQSGTILVGRSLREVEHRGSILLMQVIVAWAILMIVTILGTVYISLFAFGMSPFAFKKPSPHMPAVSMPPRQPEHEMHHEAHAPIAMHDHAAHEHSEHHHEHREDHTDTPPLA